MSECTHNCSTCSENCSSREIQKEKLNDLSSVKKVIGVVSGKGGVGKSMVTSMLATLARRKDYRTAVLDADVTGPSIPQAFGIHEKADSTGEYLIPAKSKTGIEIMSLNLLLKSESDPVVWRGPVIAGVVSQFWTDVIWDNIDIMFIDMPPGTGDVPLTVFQSLPVDGIVVVTSPQELVGMVVEKAVKMAELMNVPILGLVENYSYFECPDCKKRHYIYGESHVDEIAAAHGIDLVCQIPIDKKLAAAADAGTIELFESDALDALSETIENL